MTDLNAVMKLQNPSKPTNTYYAKHMRINLAFLLSTIFLLAIPFYGCTPANQNSSQNNEPTQQSNTQNEKKR